MLHMEQLHTYTHTHTHTHTHTVPERTGLFQQLDSQSAVFPVYGGENE